LSGLAHSATPCFFRGSGFEDRVARQQTPYP
jgi:hypothetical protein